MEKKLIDPEAYIVKFKTAEGKEVFRIDFAVGGKVTLGEGLDLDEASKIFYSNVAGQHAQHIADMNEFADCLRTYEEALKFYADPRTYLGVRFLENPALPLVVDSSFVMSIDEKNPDLQMMPGKKARVALGVENG